ncbi:MAG: hypothetical protein CMJ76_16395 [Planctomycetaceae bacterium]|nr:hypothetical protein [Planctomycetaceae bacterium]
MRNQFPVLLLFLLTATSGCVLPTFEHPASTPETSLRDDVLCGEWVNITILEDGTIQKEDETFKIGHDPKNKGWTLIGATRLNKKNELVNEVRNFLVTRIGEDNYISTPKTELDFGETDGSYILGKYHYDSKTKRLGMRWVNPIKLKEAIQRGMLLGTITEESAKSNGKEELKLKAVHVESTTEELRAFLKQYPDILFDENVEYLERVTPKD